MPLNPTGQNVMLKSGTGGGLAGVVTHIGIATLADPGTGTNANAVEATGGTPAYARLAVTWGTPAAGIVTNTNALAFDVPAGTYGAFLLFNALTGNTNNYHGYLPFGGSVEGFATVDATLTNDAFLSAAHGLVDGNRIILMSVLAEAAPAGMTEGTIYYVVQSTANSFKVSTTAGGTPVDLTGVGEVYFQRIVPETYGGQGQITVGVGQLTLSASGV